MPDASVSSHGKAALPSLSSNPILIMQLNAIEMALITMVGPMKKGISSVSIGVDVVKSDTKPHAAIVRAVASMATMPAATKQYPALSSLRGEGSTRLPHVSLRCRNICERGCLEPCFVFSDFFGVGSFYLASTGSNPRAEPYGNFPASDTGEDCKR